MNYNQRNWKTSAAQPQREITVYITLTKQNIIRRKRYEKKNLYLYLRRPWARISAWYLALQVSSGYNMVVLTTEPIAPDVASEIDSRSTDNDISSLYVDITQNYVCKKSVIFKFITDWSCKKKQE